MTPSTHSGANAAIELTDPEGNPTNLGRFGADPLVVILVRYFGCLPCQDYVRAADRAHDRFASGSRVIAVGGSADYQARWLRDTKDVTMPLLLDPAHRVRALADLGDLTPRQLSRLGGWRNYLRAMRHGFRPQVPTVDARKAPGVVVFQSDFSVAWVHRGEMMGDYPPIDDLIARVDSLTSSD